MWRIFAQVLELRWLKVRRFRPPPRKSPYKPHTTFLSQKEARGGIPWLVLLVFPTTWKVTRLYFSRKNFFRLHLTAVCLVMHGLEKKAANGASVQAAQNFGDLGKRVGWGEIVGRVYAVTTCLFLAHSLLLLPTKWRNFIIFGPKMQFLRKLVHFRVKWGLLL